MVVATIGQCDGPHQGKQAGLTGDASMSSIGGATK